MAGQQRSPLTLRASDISRVHTTLAFLAFGSSLVLGCLFHYKKIVKNGIAGYPQEWFPSVSATIGDWYPERSLFQILIALNSGPRLAMIVLQYVLQRTTSSSLPLVVLLAGLIRTLSCGGWVYITSSDDHDAHDVLMITYMLCNIPWMLGGIVCTPKELTQQRRGRITYAATFFLSMIPMIYFFIQHKVHRIPGAYTHYAFFEWGLIITDILFDSVTELDFANAHLEIAMSLGEGLDAQNKNSANVAQYTQDQSPEIVESKTRPVEYVDASDGKKSNPENPSAQPSIPESSGAFSKAFQNCKAAISFVSDLYLAYFFWTIFTALIPTLFYFSVWELGIAGAELSLLAILSPGLLGVKMFRAWAATKPGRVTLHILSLTGLAAYKFPKPAQRLLLVTFANFFLCIGAVIDWSNPSGVAPQSILLGLGLILSSLSKHANHSNNPLWPMLDEHTGGYNKAGIFLAVFSIYEWASRDQQEKTSKSAIYKEETPGSYHPNVAVTAWLPSSLALGSLLFSLHCFLTDPATLIAWTWTGYPIRGPVPHLHGSLMLVAQSIGMLLPTLGSSVTLALASPAWFIFGALSSYIIYSYKDWFGYAGGLGLAVFLMSIIPQTLQQVAASPFIGRSYFTAFFVTVVLYLASVWTVAYAFVPGGDFLRERSDLVLLVQILLLVPAFKWPGSKNVGRPTPGTSLRLRWYSANSLCVMAVVSGMVTIYRMPVTAPQPYRPGPRIVRAGIWTVHFGMDNEGRDSQRAMRDLIQDMELDVVGLLETDLHVSPPTHFPRVTAHDQMQRTVYGNRDLKYVDLGPGPNQHTWGAVLLSKFPILNSTHHLLPSPRGELAPAISAFLDIYGTEVLVIVAHNGQEEDPLDRELQSAELARIMRSSLSSPAIFLGYIVTKPHATRPSPYQILVEDGMMHDIDADDLDRWCEYIFYRGLYRTSYLRVSRGKVTDTELQVGQFVVPHYGHTVSDDSVSARYLRIHKETLDTPHWFPMEYYGDENAGGKNGHYYHVFGTPLYYNLPEGAVL